jgi:hypothetical protein
MNDIKRLAKKSAAFLETSGWILIEVSFLLILSVIVELYKLPFFFPTAHDPTLICYTSDTLR